MTIVGDTVAWLTDPVQWVGPNGIPARLAEHVAISAVSLVLALAIALPVGLYIGHTRRGAALAVGAANLWRALPSLAVIAIVLPFTAAIDPRAGFLLYPTIAAMVVLAVPPILVNTYTGVTAVESDVVEAARGQGLSGVQVLRRVEVPLALPAIVTGIRSGVVQVIATATLGAVFGFGALGRYLIDGIAQRDLGQIGGGVVLVVTLVIAAELLFTALERLVTPRGLRRAGRGRDLDSPAVLPSTQIRV